ncbi:hypothetical protein N9Z27_01385 [Alphaproteobacteria bacterium]|nr:hypothetical protein [Alphaproteobacteria bacterium]
MIFKKSLVLLCASLTFSPILSATSSELEELKMTAPGDLEMSCGKLSQEALNMRDVIYNTQNIKDNSTIQSHGITAAGAIGSLIIGTATGGIGLAAAGFLMDQNVSGNAEDAESLQDIAQQRRSFIIGIYGAKGCYGPMDHAMQDPQPFDPIEKLAAIETASGEGYQTTLRNRYND